MFSDHQLNGLEKRFDGQKYLSTPERVELANALNLSEAQVSDKRTSLSLPDNNPSSLSRFFSSPRLCQG